MDRADVPLASVAVVDPIFSLFHAALRRHGQVTFVLADLDGHHGLADRGSGTVFLDAANTDGEMRATAVHEVVHLAHPEFDEEDVERLTALALVPLADARAASDRADFEEVAERLQVDVKLVRARRRHAEEDTARSSCADLATVAG